MPTIRLTHHTDDTRLITLQSEDIATMERGNDAAFHPEAPSDYTKVMLKDGCTTNEGVQCCYVRETGTEILQTIAALNKQAAPQTPQP